MHIGLMFANTGVSTRPEGAVAVAEHAEAAGFHSLWTVEHVVIPAGYESPYPYTQPGWMAGSEDSPVPDPLIWLAYVAARTSRLLLCTGVLILPQRSPLITAKEVATLDQLSGGRVRLGVGIGWLREEFEAIGAPFEERAARTEEAIAAMRTLWSQKAPTFAGRFYRFQDARMWPKPVRGTVPVVIGGHSEAAARRAGRLGDGDLPARGEPRRHRRMDQRDAGGGRRRGARPGHGGGHRRRPGGPGRLRADGHPGRRSGGDPAPCRGPGRRACHDRGCGGGRPCRRGADGA